MIASRENSPGPFVLLLAVERAMNVFTKHPRTLDSVFDGIILLVIVLAPANTPMADIDHRAGIRTGDRSFRRRGASGECHLTRHGYKRRAHHDDPCGGPIHVCTAGPRLLLADGRRGWLCANGCAHRLGGGRQWRSHPGSGISAWSVRNRPRSICALFVGFALTSMAFNVIRGPACH